MNSIATRSICLMSTLCLGLASMVFASQCLDLSPTISSGRKFADAIALRKLTDSEHRHVETLLKSLDGRWIGEAAEVACNLADIDDRDMSRYAIKATVETDRTGNFIMEAELYSAEERTSHQKTLRFYLKDQYLRVHHNNGAGDVELIEVSDTHFELRYLLRVQNLGNPGGIYREFFYRLASTPNGFSIVQTIYTQGRLNGLIEWRFHHD